MGKQEELLYVSDREKDAELVRRAIGENSPGTTVSSLAEIVRAAVGGTGLTRVVEDNHTDTLSYSKPIGTEAVLNFNSFLLGLAEKPEEIERIKGRLFNMTFKQGADYLEKEIVEICEINDENVRQFIEFKQKYLEKFDPLVKELKKQFLALQIEVFQFAFSTGEMPDEEILFEKLDIAESHYLKTLEFLALNFEPAVDKTKKLFLRLKTFTGSGRRIYSDNDNVDNTTSIMNTLNASYEDLFSIYLSVLFEFDYLNISDIAELIEKITNSLNNLNRLAEVKEESMKDNYIEEQDLPGFCKEVDEIYLEDLGKRKENKLRIFLAFEKLFFDFAESPSKQRADEISKLLRLIEPGQKNSPPLRTVNVPYSFISDHELRALRYYFASIFAKVVKSGENFKVEEFRYLAKIFDELSLQETIFTVMCNHFYTHLPRFSENKELDTFLRTNSPLWREGFLENEEIGAFLRKQVLDMENGLVVRDGKSGFSMANFEIERYKDGDRWFYLHSARNCSPNYAMDLKPHSISGKVEQYDEVYFDSSMSFYKLDDYTDIFAPLQALEDDLDDLMMTVGDESFVDTLFEADDFEKILDRIEKDLKIAMEHNVDKKYEILQNFSKIGKMLGANPSAFSKEQLEKLFELINNMTDCFVQFSLQDVISLKFYVLYKLLSIESFSKGDISEWQYDLIFKVSRLREKYEEVLSSLLPDIDKVEDYIMSFEDKEVAESVVKQLRLCEWGLSGRYSDMEKECEKGSVMPSYEEYLRIKNAGNEVLIEESDEVEVEESIDDVVDEDLDDYILAPLLSHKIYNLISKYALPTSLVLLVITLTVISFRRMTEVDENEGVEISSTELTESESAKIMKKYLDGEIVYLSSDENDDFGFIIMSNFWEGIEDKEEARTYFMALDKSKRREINIVLIKITESLIGLREGFSYLETRKEIENILNEKI